MYILFSIFIIILLFFFVINHSRKKCIIRKICCMTLEEKCNLLNAIIEPMGFSYLADQDIFTSTRDAWQRKMGYQSLYNRGAVHFNMVFDYLPVYFDYNDKTWMIQLWKGQYGVNTGGEIGVYYADHIVSQEQLDTTLFQAVDDSDILKNVNVSDTRWEMCFSADLRSLVAHRIFYGVIFMAKTALPECLHHLSRLCNDECIYRRAPKTVLLSM